MIGALEETDAESVTSISGWKEELREGRGKNADPHWSAEKGG